MNNNQNNRPHQNQGQSRPAIIAQEVKQKTVSCEGTTIKKVIDEMSSQGWEYYDTINQGGNNYTVVFKK